jgi:hypothetical protein
MSDTRSDQYSPVAPHRNAVLALDEQDYLYGCGTLALRVERLGADPRSFPKLEWVRIVGQEIGWNGSETPRDVMVRVEAIGRSLRPADWRPSRYRRPT